MNAGRRNGDLGFDIFNYALFAIFMLAVLYPLYWIFTASVSVPGDVTRGGLYLWPDRLDLSGYRTIFGYSKIWTGYGNSLLYMTLGTCINVILTLTSGYVLSRKDLAGRGLFMLLIVFPMFFSGGLIPTYLVVQQLGMENTIWAMVIPSAVGSFNIIIARTFFQSTVPHELLESAMIDGGTNFRFFLSIAVPLSMPLIAVIIIFTAVGYWNSYFPALIYLRDEAKYPLQMILRSILILETMETKVIDPGGMKNFEEKRIIAEQIKYGVIVVSSLPVLVLYPFLQKYFVKGMMIGAVKG